ncbi:MAG: DUF4292 domain-containing protein [Chlorobi bacterium]|nr:DUF4292 domain-containing protein [Chlorobiota bacterium]
MRLVTILLGIIMLSSCGALKKIFKGKQKEEARRESLMPIVTTIENRTQKINTLQEKLRVTISSGSEKQSVSVLVRYKRDSILWFSVLGPMNIEVMRGIVRPDSFFVLNKFAKQVYYGEITSLGGKYGISNFYHIVNSLLLGSIPSQGYTYRLVQDSLLLVDTALGVTYQIAVKDTVLSRVYAQRSDESYVLHIQSYKEVNLKNGVVRLPAEWYMKTQGMELYIKQTSVKVNHKLRFPFKVPDKYNKVPFNY